MILKEEVQLQEEIGRGRYGVAFRGLYKGRVVAVKVSRPFYKRSNFLCLSYALKVSNPVRSRADYEAAQEGIIREVGTFCRCKHPSLVRLVPLYYIHFLCNLLRFIPRYYGVVTNQPGLNFWMVTEFVTGHCLAKLLQQPDLKSLYKIRRKERLRMSACLASAMDYLHNR